MSADIHPKSTVFVIFGIGGDLARRKLIPALYDLFLDQWLPENSWLSDWVTSPRAIGRLSNIYARG